MKSAPVSLREKSTEQPVEQADSIRKLRLFDHEWRRQQQKVAARGERNACIERGFEQSIECRGSIGPRSQRHTCRAILHQLDDGEKPVPATHIANDGVARLQFLQLVKQSSSQNAGAVDEIFFPISLERSEPGRTGERMPAIGEPGI